MNPHFFHRAAAFLLGSACVSAADSFPSDLEAIRFSGPDMTPSPACLCVSAQGEVYVGVDLNGSLGKGPGKGHLVKLVDKDGDGKADSHTNFADVDNPRGLISIGDKLYVLHTSYGSDGKSTGMDLVVLRDKDGDGKADGEPKMLVKGICSAVNVNNRGTDHSTNGIRLGVDGWIYIAVGDFGFVDATGTDGTKLTLLGGGVARVQPDGSELQMYTTGTRNIYDVAIDPFMNVFTRGNTNDGGGWNVRFLHHIESGEYGYPRLFINFADEILPALGDLGGGSGTGSYFLSEPGWPEQYNNEPLMADWGRQTIYLHRLSPDGASFTQVSEEFAKVAQVTDLDVSPSGAMFIAAWDGAGFSGSDQKGYIVRLTPKGWKPAKVPDFPKISSPELVALLKSPSATTRFYAQQEMVARTADWTSLTKPVSALIEDKSLPLANRVAALFTLEQIIPDSKAMMPYLSDRDLSEFAMRAVSDHLPRLKNDAPDLPLFEQILAKGTERQKAAAAIALGRLGDVKAAPSLLLVPFVKPGSQDEPGSKAPRHATPNSKIILPHLAEKALVRLNAVDDCLAAVGTSSEDLALWTLSNIHEERVADGLIAKLKTAPTQQIKNKIIATLARLYQREAPYDGSWWWSTRPDTRGPYYKPITWAASPRIAEALDAQLKDATPETKKLLTRLNDRERMELLQFGSEKVDQKMDQAPTVDLANIASKKGAIATTPIEDVILSVDTLKPNKARGEKLFTQQGCVACHALNGGGPSLGPFMGQIGSIMTPEQIATAILRPSDTISQGFQSVSIKMKDGSVKAGFVTESTPEEMILRDVTGTVTTVQASDIAEQTYLPKSMMPEGLANALSLEDFAALVHFLASHK